MRKLTILTAAVAVGLLALVSGQANATHCTTFVTAPASIQAAVDGASFGDVVCLDDSGGDFDQEVVFGPEDSGITLSAAHGDSPVLDGSSGLDFAIELLDGVTDVTIEHLEIHEYTNNARSSAILAWDVDTSNITVRYNTMHNFSWNAVLVGSEGGFIHDNWMVKNNRVDDTGFVGIELTNCEDCSILANIVDDAVLGIVVQARNTVAESGDVVINGVHVIGNDVDNSVFGIYVLSFTGHPTAFTPITGASTLLKSVNMSNNNVSGSSVVGIRFWAFNDDATAKNGRIMHNVIVCPASTAGVEVRESGSGQTGTVKNAKVVNNDFSIECTSVVDQGEDTKLPPGIPLPS